jgi:predicted CoA-binding protein
VFSNTLHQVREESGKFVAHEVRALWMQSDIIQSGVNRIQHSKALIKLVKRIKEEP